jgi:hypothetical protein
VQCPAGGDRGAAPHAADGHRRLPREKARRWPSGPPGPAAGRDAHGCLPASGARWLASGVAAWSQAPRLTGAGWSGRRAGSIALRALRGVVEGGASQDAHAPGLVPSFRWAPQALWQGGGRQPIAHEAVSSGLVSPARSPNIWEGSRKVPGEGSATRCRPRDHIRPHASCYPPSPRLAYSLFLACLTCLVRYSINRLISRCCLTGFTKVQFHCVFFCQF